MKSRTKLTNLSQTLEEIKGTSDICLDYSKRRFISKQPLATSLNSL